MKFRVERDVLAEAVAWAARALPTRPPNPAAAGLLIKAEDGSLVLSSYDLEATSEATIDADVSDDGTTLVSGRLLADICRSLPAAPVQFELNGTRAEITCGRANFTLPTLPVEDYPALPEVPTAVGTVDGSEFAAAAAQVSIAAGRDDNLAMLQGVRVEIDGPELTLAATDRYRLAVRTLGWTPAAPIEPTAATIPARALSDAAKSFVGADEVTIGLGTDEGTSGLAGFTAAGRETTSRLMDGEFPAYRKLLPDTTDTLATVSVDELSDALKRVALVAKTNTPVKLEFTGSEVTLRAGTGDEAQASEAVECMLVGEPIEIAFNPTFLLEGLSALGLPYAALGFTLPNRPAILRGAETAEAEPRDDYRYLLMPVQLSQ